MLQCLARVPLKSAPSHARSQFPSTTQLSAAKWHLDRLSHFAQLTCIPSTQTTLCATSVTMGRVCALHAGNAVWVSADCQTKPVDQRLLVCMLALLHPLLLSNVITQPKC